MTNEKIIYLGPEEEMTNVRERLENTDAGKIILVIPPQTHLRSHVGWRLLHSRVRELKQDVLIISSDRQIRSVAKAAGFRIADSLESPTTDRPRPTNRTARSDMSGKTSQGSRKQANNGSRASRSLQSSQRQMPASSDQIDSIYDSPENRGRETNAYTPSTFEIEDVPYGSHYDDMPFETIPSPRYDEEEQEGSEVNPLTADYADYYVARSIREAAQGPESSRASSTDDSTETSSSPEEQFKKIPQFGELEDDSFGYLEDNHVSDAPEQRNSAFIHDLDHGVSDISDIPTDVYDADVEDLGDVSDAAFHDDWQSHASDIQEPPLTSSSGNRALPTFEDLGDEDHLLPATGSVEDQPTRVTPISQARPGTASTTSKREPQPIIQPSPQARRVQTNPPTQQTKKPVTAKTSRVVTTPPLTRQAPSKSNRNGRKYLLITSISIGVLLIAFLLFIYFGANATVTVVVPSQSVSATNQYVASMDPQSGQQNTIPSQVLRYTATARGQGQATGTSKQGNQIASGTVSFTNTGSTSLDIPTGTVLSTSGATPVQFVTIADVLVLPGASNSIPSPVQAQLPGDSGNVPANSITIIPPDSLAKIAQNNPKATAPTPQTLKVTNANPTTGGGATNVPAVSSSDVNALAATLQKQIQKEINAWLNNVVHPGDKAGTPVPDVLASPAPLPQETFVTTPSVGQPAPGGKFTGVLTASVSVLVIRNAAIQAAGRAQLTAKASQMNPPAVLATSLPITVNVAKSTPSQDGKSLTVVIDSSGHVVQKVQSQQISQQLAGKSVDQANTYITSGQAGLTGVVNTNIVVFPPFFSIMPFRSGQIHIVIVPGPVKGATNG
ncbi:MAG: baseplate J/gp47 family protein [Ktedonobacteraceae bacterium]